MVQAAVQDSRTDIIYQLLQCYCRRSAPSAFFFTVTALRRVDTVSLAQVVFFVFVHAFLLRLVLELIKPNSEDKMQCV